MKKLRILKSILIRTKANKMLLSYLLFLFVSAVIITLVEPDIHTIRDALWYVYAVITTVGFGDIVVTTFLGKAMSILISVYSILVIAIVTGVIVNFYGQIIQIQQKETLAFYIDKMEHLPDMSKEELNELFDKIKNLKIK